MITQYNGGYSSIPADFQNLIANKCNILDRYIIMQTGENEYSGLIYNPCTKECKQYTLSRSSSNYNSYYVLNERAGEFEYSISNQYYVFSNDGVGKSLELPITNSVTAFSMLIISCTLMFAIVFKGVLFKCLKQRR